MMNKIILKLFLALSLGLQLDFCYASQSDNEFDELANRIAENMEKSIVLPVQKSKNAIYQKEGRLKDPKTYRGYGQTYHKAMLKASTVTEEQFLKLSSEAKDENLKRLEQFRKLRRRKAGELNYKKSDDVINNELKSLSDNSVEKNALLCDSRFVQLLPQQKQAALNDFEQLRKFKITHKAIQALNVKYSTVSSDLNGLHERLNFPEPVNCQNIPSSPVRQLPEVQLETVNNSRSPLKKRELNVENSPDNSVGFLNYLAAAAATKLPMRELPIAVDSQLLIHKPMNMNKHYKVDNCLGFLVKVAIADVDENEK